MSRFVVTVTLHKIDRTGDGQIPKTVHRFTFRSLPARITMGRSPTCDIPLHHTWEDVSKRHATIEIRCNERGIPTPYLRDEGSTNGTFVSINAQGDHVETVSRGGTALYDHTRMRSRYGVLVHPGNRRRHALSFSVQIERM